MYDVAVVGTGPSGCATALALAASGASVMMLEKAALPRYKTCGGGLLRRASQLLPVSIDAAVERKCFDVALNFTHPELQFVTRRRESMIQMTMRADLDHLLQSEAQNAGALLMDCCAVGAVEQHPDFVSLHTSRGEVRARFAIAADGANSAVATAAGWIETRKLIPALEVEVHVNEADFARLSPLARFDVGVIDAGYAWMFPKRSHLSVGVLSMRRGKVHLQNALDDYFKLLGIREPLKIEKHGYVIPVTPRQGLLAKGRILLTGDAAGLADPVTAEGITHAILSGQLAARTLVDCAFDVAQVARLYQTRLEQDLLPELKAARCLARLLYEHPRLCAWAFRHHGQALSELVADIVMGKRSYRETLFKPGSYLRLLGF